MDGLTNIPNRRYFDEALQQEWNRSARFGFRLGSMLVDIDYFKQYNDHYGHVRGDECLKKVASLLKEGLSRSSDILARYGGEEFVVLVPHADHAELQVLGNKIREKVYASQILHEGRLYDDIGVVTISIGCCSVYPQIGIPPEQLLRMADSALYDAKELGRNQVAVRCEDLVQKFG